MDTSTTEIAVEPDGEHHSALLGHCENFSYGDTQIGSKKQSATSSSIMEFDESPFNYSTDDFVAPFTSNDVSESTSFEFGAQESDSVANLSEKPDTDTSVFEVSENPSSYDANHYSVFGDLEDPMGHVHGVLTFDQDAEQEVKDEKKCEIPPETCVSNPEIYSEDGFNIGNSAESSSSKDVGDMVNIDPEIKTEVVGVEYEISSDPCIPKCELLSEDENNFDGGKSSSSKDGSPSEPSCSGTSRTGPHSLTSDSEDELPSRNISLPLKKRKREKVVEILSSSSCSEDESQADIDYANLTPEQIKALIEQAKRYGRVKRKCKCPKKKWSELPIVGPIQGSGKCTIGKGDWSEKVPETCLACSGGSCDDAHHKRRRHNRRRALPIRNPVVKPRARGTIGVDVPIIELSDSEEVTTAPTSVVSEVTISAVPSGECIVLSSSEDDDDIVCERVIQSEVKVQATEPEVGAKHPKPDVIVINSTPSVTSSFIPTHCPQSHTVFPSLSTTQCLPAPLLPVPLGQDSETWPDLNVDLESWDETMNLLANICGPPPSASSSQPVATPPERPPTPEGWTCPICLESKTAVNEIMSTTCGHVFCGNCIRSSVRIHKKCPTCRKKLTMKQFHKIFL